MFRRQFLAMCLGMLTMPTIGWCQAPPKVAVLAGVNRYQHSDLNQPKSLEFAENDVKAMKEVLEQSGYKVYLLLGKEATRDAIDKTLQKARKDTGDGGVFLIGFAGHGFQPEKGDQAYFCPFDTDKKALPKEGEDPWDYETMMPLSNVLGYMKSSPATSRVLLMDACRNDPVAGRGRGVGTNLKIADIPNTAVLLSCSAGQKSFEDKALGGGHGVFFHHVLSGLRGDPMVQKNGKLNLDLLWSYLEEEVPAQVKKIAKDPFSGTAPNQEPYRLVNGKVDLQILAKAGRGVIPKMVPKEPKNGNTVTVELGGGEKLELVRVPKGENMLGSSEDDLKKVKELFNKSQDVEEYKKFTLDYELLMGKTHVTVGQFKRFFAETKHETDGDKNGSYGWNATKKDPEKDKKYSWRNPGFTQGDDHPVVCVSWNDAKAFCEWLEGKVQKQLGTKYKVRLPKEEEWEYACRAGSRSLWYFGDDPEDLAKHANTADVSFRQATGKDWGIKADDDFDFTMPVGKKGLNKWGFADMHGNAWQWCENLYSKDSTNRVLRGGSWNFFTSYSRAAYCISYAPVSSSNNVGFRVVALP